jgi:hypothetical protein
MRHATLILAAAAAALLLPAVGARADDDRYDDDRRAEIEREYLQRRAELERDYQRALREQRRDDARRHEEALRRDRERYERDAGRTVHVVRREAYDRYRDVAPPVLVAPSGAALGYRGYTPDGPVTYAPDYAPPPPSYGWDAYGPPAAGAGGDLPPAYVPPAELPVPVDAGPVARHAALLTSQVDSFLGVFAPTAGVVPEGGAFLREAQELAEASRAFQALLATGAPPAALADSFRVVEGRWSRLARRTERVAKGRTGPNIQQVQLMGTTLEAIRRDWAW